MILIGEKMKKNQEEIGKKMKMKVYFSEEKDENNC